MKFNNNLLVGVPKFSPFLIDSENTALLRTRFHKGVKKGKNKDAPTFVFNIRTIWFSCGTLKWTGSKQYVQKLRQFLSNCVLTIPNKCVIFQVERWLRLRRLQQLPNTLQKFQETGWRWDAEDNGDLDRFPAWLQKSPGSGSWEPD